jgi:hypothetical protein
MGRLSKAIKQWIRAEYAFRHGPNAYHGNTTDKIIEAEENLREVLTGHRQLGSAGASLGCTPATERQPAKLNRGKRAPAEPDAGKPLRKRHKSGGLFNEHE